MGKRVLVVILSVLLSLMSVSCTCMKHIALRSEEGFIVRIAPSGKVVNAVRCDGSEVRYAPEEKKRIPGAVLAFFSEGKYSFLKKVNGKWKKEVWEEECLKEMSDVAQSRNVKKDDIEQGIIVHVSSEGNILSVANFDGSELQYSECIDFSKARLATKNWCCWRSTPSGALCRCQYCWWGCQ